MTPAKTGKWFLQALVLLSRTGNAPCEATRGSPSDLGRKRRSGIEGAALLDEDRCSEIMKISLEYIVDHVKSLKSKPYKTFVSKLVDLTHQIESAMMLRGPYRLVLDSNIVMRLESLRQGKITEGVLATLLAFLFVKRLPFHVDLVIRPVVFYEFLRQRNVQDLREHWQEIRALKEIVEESLDC
ncbi:hypothetical protein NID80_24050 [Paraburkholderia megapolitana]|nr:hypothetical protein [Paraburkholderia megapolitana]MDN7160061.1 hypothetical protein [Paraburkholderia sp. CHISQ3]MDQ6497108.1 hypothetical protein [Paraburkholderia megapolitana]